MLNLEVRKKTGGTELHRVNGGAVTVGASSGNEVVVRARGVAGRHVRILEKDGGYHLDLYKGVDAVAVNGQAFLGGPIAPGDRITIGEATITITAARAPMRPTPIQELRITDTATPPAAPGRGGRYGMLVTRPVAADHGHDAIERVGPPPGASRRPRARAGRPDHGDVEGRVPEYRGLRMAVYRLCRESRAPEQLATELVDFLDREFVPSEWAVGDLSDSGFRPLASTFLESPALPPRILEDVAAGERVVRAETVTGVLTLLVEPVRGEGASFAILVRESPRLAARAILLLEEIVQVAGVAVSQARESGTEIEREGTPVPVVVPPRPDPLSNSEAALRETDDLKKIMDTVTREVIDRAMRRVEGNQSRGAAVLNISRGSLIAKLKEFQIPDYRYLRRERTRRP